MGFGLFCFIIILGALTVIGAYYLFNIHKVDRIIQRTWVSVWLVVFGTAYMLVAFFIGDCLIHQNYNPSVHDFVRLYGMFSQTNSAYSVEPSEPEPFYIMLSFIGAVTFSGLMISAFTNMYSQRIHRLREGLISYNFSKHIVIIGGNSSILTIINSTSIVNDPTHPVQNDCKDSQKNHMGPKILILTSKHPSELAYLKDCIDPRIWKRIFIINDNILRPLPDTNVSTHYLCKGKVKNAREIYIIGDNESESSDTDNLTILHHLVNYFLKYGTRNSAGMKNCYVAYSNVEMFITSLREYDYKKDKNISHHLRIIPYDFNLLLASKVWGAAYDPPSYQELKPAADGVCNIVIIGFTSIAQAMLKMAILKCHFGSDSSTSITIYHLDSQRRSVDLFNTNYDTSSLQDINVNFRSVSSLECVDNYIGFLEGLSFSTIVLCSEFVDINLQLAYAIKKRIPDSDILVYNPIPLLQNLMTDNEGKRIQNVNSFGNLNQAIEFDAIQRECLILCMIREYIKKQTHRDKKIEEIYNLTSAQLEQRISRTKKRAFLLSFDTVKWQLYTLLESFLSINSNFNSKITERAIINQQIAAVVLAGYSINNELVSKLDQKEAYRRKIVSSLSVGISNSEIIIDIYRKLKNEHKI